MRSVSVRECDWYREQKNGGFVPKSLKDVKCVCTIAAGARGHYPEFMTSSSKDPRSGGPQSKIQSSAQKDMPGWTAGLRQLYDEVVEEDLPDSFHDLLAKLDNEDS